MSDSVSRRAALKTAVAAAGIAVLPEELRGGSSSNLGPASLAGAARPVPASISRERETAFAPTLKDLPACTTQPTDALDQPFDRVEKLWKDLTDQKKVLYGERPVLQSDKPVPDSRQLRPLLHTFVESAVLLPPATRFVLAHKAQWPANQVDRLIGQLADGIDRATVALSAWEEMRVRAFALTLDLDEFAAIDDLHQEETRQGFYTLTFREAEAAADFEAQALVAAEPVAQEYKDLGAYVKPSADALKQSSKEAKLQTEYDFAGRAFDWTVAEQQNKSSLAELRDREMRARLQKYWSACDATFHRTRQAIARELAMVRFASAVTPGGAMNFAERMGPLASQFSEEMTEIFSLLPAVVDGFRSIHEYSDPLPPIASEMLSGTVSPDISKQLQLLNELRMWTRRASRFLEIQTLSDQVLIRPLSLKRLNPKAFEHLRKQGTAAFAIGESLLSGFSHVRMRGVSAYAVGGHESDVWPVSLTAPTSIIAANPTKSGELTQPPRTVSLGRVTARNGPRPPDVAGAVHLFNLSPFGSWTISVGTSLNGGEREDLSDLTLDLIVACRAAGVPA